MSRREFTEDQLQALSANPYTLNVTPKHITFTAEFKEIFWNRYEEGCKPSAILRECGYNPEVLGAARVSGIQTMIRKEAQSSNSFHEGRAAKGSRKSVDESVEERLRQLEGRVQFLEAQMDFLKKTRLAQTKGR